MPKSIKILHILPSLVRAGAERVVYDLSLGLPKDRFQSGILLFKDNGAGADWRTELVGQGVKIFSLRKRCLVDAINFWQIYQEIKKFSPDIVHTHLGGDIYGRLAAKLAGVPVIVSTEHNLNVSESGLAAYFKKITTRFAEKVFAVSQAVKEDCIVRYNLPLEKVEVIYNGIDLNRFQAKQKDISKPYVIGALGRLTTQKGFSVLIEAISYIKNQNIIVKIAGQGELKNTLKKQIAKLKLESKVELVGLVEPVDFLSSIDIFVAPSLWEGLGLSALEAGAMNKPVIASEIDGLREIINDKTGFLFPASQAKELAKQLDFVLENLEEDIVKQKSLSLQAKIKNDFSLKKMQDDYVAWYERLSV